MAESGFKKEGVGSAHFLFEVDGQTIGRFMEVGGLSVDVSVENIEEGGENGFVHHLPGRMTWPNLTLKRGVTQSDNLFAWMRKSSGEQFAANGNKLTRSTGAITLISNTRTRLRAWNIIDAFPVKWSGPTLAAGSSESAVENLEITHHGFTATTP